MKKNGEHFIIFSALLLNFCHKKTGERSKTPGKRGMRLRELRNKYAQAYMCYWNFRLPLSIFFAYDADIVQKNRFRETH
ncbi:MAG: hypothetical protein DSY80_01165 [Desulfocapsa sp.]|nr:MAG: hypothetical protein DSY80_01165 [Desulfocapsa sp.]